MNITTENHIKSTWQEGMHTYIHHNIHTNLCITTCKHIRTSPRPPHGWEYSPVLERGDTIVPIEWVLQKEGTRMNTAACSCSQIKDSGSGLYIQDCELISILPSTCNSWTQNSPIVTVWSSRKRRNPSNKHSQNSAAWRIQCHNLSIKIACTLDSRQKGKQVYKARE